ncbi:hypothetical protein KSF_110400 [Reticulibacter mediterranei]|uniref:DUF2306 domain-containing protein n=1 Tax=Reticulibacter mediterranei TaxID=2778369 RepID=A0A8J3J270_9CHLR|nr:DUF2306 domain-containing protein [Reticulibacter mediterranei]GHP00993.1 hypothetical protein KSF_110400 [Reticulibacter mediterranei]
MTTHNKSALFPRGGAIAWGLLTLFAIAIALFFAAPYVTFDAAVSRIPLNPVAPLHFTVLALHAITGGIALLVGPFQFLPRFRTRFPAVHRITGRIYVACIIIGSIMAAYSAIVSTAGFVAQVGFLLLASIWFYSIVQAYMAIRQGHIQLHRIWMIRNYALTSAAIFLRIWLGLGVAYLAKTHTLHGDVTSTPVYTSAAWISWIVPLVFAEWFIIQRFLRPIALKQEKVDKQAQSVKQA